MTGRLASKVVVVTGGGTGIGRAVAARAAGDGAAVVIGGRRQDVGERAATELREGGGRALFVASDEAAFITGAALAIDGGSTAQ